MKNFKALSAILSEPFLIDENFAHKILPQVIGLFSGAAVEFEGMHTKNQESEELLSTHIQAVSASACRLSHYTNYEEISENTVGVIDIAGPILKYGGMSSYGTMDYVTMINKASKSSKISGIVLRIDSPGGQANGTQELVRAIENAKSTGKRVVAYVDNGMAASAAMWIAAAADEIVLSQELDTLGSIGAFVTLADFKEYFEKEGIKIYEIYSRMSAQKNQEVRELFDNGNDELIKDRLDKLVSTFQNDILRLRPETLNTLDKWKEGAVFYGEEAIAVKLADRYATLEDAIASAQGEINMAGISQNQQSVNLFGKKSSCNKLVSTAVDERTEDQFTAANAELSEHGLCLVNASLEDFEAEQTTQKAALSNAEKEIAQLKTYMAAKESALVEAKNRANAAEALAAAYGEKPGEMPTNTAAQQINLEGEEKELSDANKELVQRARMNGVKVEFVNKL